MTDTAEFQRLLTEEIPLAAAMGVQVSGYDGSVLVLAAPFAPNVNHKSTVFGGSLYGLMVLAGWGLITLRLRAEGLAGVTVIQQAEIDYRRPVTGDFQARCALPEAAAWERFLRVYRRRGMGRLRLTAQVPASGEPAAVLHAGYVVQRPGEGR